MLIFDLILKSNNTDRYSWFSTSDTYYSILSLKYQKDIFHCRGVYVRVLDNTRYHGILFSVDFFIGYVSVVYVYFEAVTQQKNCQISPK